MGDPDAIAAAAAVTPTADRQERVPETPPKKASPTGPPPKKKLDLDDTVRESPSVSFFVGLPAIQIQNLVSQVLRLGCPTPSSCLSYSFPDVVFVNRDARGDPACHGGNKHPTQPENPYRSCDQPRHPSKLEPGDDSGPHHPSQHLEPGDDRGSW